MGGGRGEGGEGRGRGEGGEGRGERGGGGGEGEGLGPLFLNLLGLCSTAQGKALNVYNCV